MPWAFQRVALVRHCETEWNLVGRRQGQLDSPLTPAGLLHAEGAARRLSETTVDGLFASPLGRARRTAELIGEVLDLPVVVVDELAELHHGSFAGLTNEEIEGRHSGELGRRTRTKYTWSFPGGESYADADVRAAKALRTIASHGVEAPALVTHEMLGRMLLRNLLGTTPEEAVGWHLPHGDVIELVAAAPGRMVRKAGSKG